MSGTLRARVYELVPGEALWRKVHSVNVSAELGESITRWGLEDFLAGTAPHPMARYLVTAGGVAQEFRIKTTLEEV